jgi:hypothetical protein
VWSSWKGRAPLSALVIGALTVGALAAACVEQDDEKPTEDDMKTAKQNILTTAPTPKFPVNADLDGKLTYIGLDADPATVEPGKDIKLTHYWKLVGPPGDGWKIFTHLEGPNKQNFINADHAPVKGKYAVAAWKPGEIIRDEHTVRLPANWPYPQVLVYVGLWRTGGGRLPLKSGPHDAEGRVLAATIPVHAAEKAPPPRKRYVARMLPKGTKPPTIDGKLDDAAWAQATSTGPFVNTLTGGPVDQKTEAKLLWDQKFLYVAFDNADTDVWSSLNKRDDKLWTQEADELMIDADGNGKTYVELQVAPTGAVFDTYLPEYRKYEDAVDPKKKQFSWNSKLTAKVQVNGTLNKRDDQDKGWTVEMAIPLEDVKGLDKDQAIHIPPNPGDVWRINMYRMDMPQGKPQQASGWAPPMVGDFHALDKFGELVFGDDKGNIAKAPPAPATAGGNAPGPAAAGDRKETASVKGSSNAAKKPK